MENRLNFIKNKMCKRIIRAFKESKEDLLYELGDVLWYLSNLAFELNYTLEDVAKVNLDKLGVRMKNDKIKGSGDNR